MSKKMIEDIINNVLNGDAKVNALDLVAHIRALEESDNYTISMHDEKDETGWVASNLGFIFISGSDDFPGPWTMWMEAGNIGEGLEHPADDHIKEFAWSHVSPCGSCGGNCSPGISTKVFGKDFDNTCQSNLIFINPSAETVNSMKKLVDIKREAFLIQKGN